MTSQKRMVSVKQLPTAFAGRQRADFLGELQTCLNADRPCIVLDCSSLGQTDGEIVYLLLSCLEEAMKRNGDVRLAGVSAKTHAALQAAQADALFAFYETSADAVASFYGRPAGFALRDSAQDAELNLDKNVA